MRDFVRAHPGRYAAGNAAALGGPDDPLRSASTLMMTAWAAMLDGYGLDQDEQIHAQRMLRSLLHGFATLEAAGGFQIETPVDRSFSWISDFTDRALRAPTSSAAVRNGSSAGRRTSSSQTRTSPRDRGGPS